MKHVFRATLIGWKREQEGVYFDSDQYTKEEAEAQFKPYRGMTQQGFPYTGYEYGGKKYYGYMYLGEYEDDKIPRNDAEYNESLLGAKK